MLLTAGIMFANYSNLHWIACLPLHAIWKWHTETLVWLAEGVTEISQKEPINETLILIILMCCVTDTFNLSIKPFLVLCDIHPICFKNLFLYYVIRFAQYSY